MTAESTAAAVVSGSSDSSGLGTGPGSSSTCETGSSSGGPGVSDSRSSIQGSSVLAPDDAGGGMPPVSISTDASQQQQGAGASAATVGIGKVAEGCPQPHSPTAAAAAGHAGGHIGLQGRSGSCSSTGSGSWASAPQHEGSPDTQLKAK